MILHSKQELMQLKLKYAAAKALQTANTPVTPAIQKMDADVKLAEEFYN